jgi:hypothetical protein
MGRKEKFSFRHFRLPSVCTSLSTAYTIHIVWRQREHALGAIKNTHISSHRHKLHSLWDVREFGLDSLGILSIAMCFRIQQRTLQQCVLGDVHVIIDVWQSVSCIYPWQCQSNILFCHHGFLRSAIFNYFCMPPLALKVRSVVDGITVDRSNSR